MRSEWQTPAHWNPIDRNLSIYKVVKFFQLRSGRFFKANTAVLFSHLLFTACLVGSDHNRERSLLHLWFADLPTITRAINPHSLSSIQFLVSPDRSHPFCSCKSGSARFERFATVKWHIVFCILYGWSVKWLRRFNAYKSYSRFYAVQRFDRCEWLSIMNGARSEICHKLLVATQQYWYDCRVPACAVNHNIMYLTYLRTPKRWSFRFGQNDE